MKLSTKSIVSIVAGSALVSGASVAVPLAVTLVGKNAQEASAAIAQTTLQVPYKSDLPMPPNRPGYAPPVLESTTYVAGMSVANTGITADYRFSPDGSNPTLAPLVVKYRVIIVKAPVQPEQKSVEKTYTYRSAKEKIELVPLEDFPPRDGTGFLPWDYENPSWWRQTPSIQKIEFADIESIEVGTRFYALYSSKVDAENYTGNSDTFRVYYSVVKSNAQQVVVKQTAEITYGETVLPGANVTLPALGEGYGAWTGPDYFDENNLPVTSASLAKMDVGKTFTVKWIAYLDRKQYGGEDSVYEIVYTVKPKQAPSPTPSLVEDFASAVYGNMTLPKLPVNALPELPPVGWLFWIAEPEYFAGRTGTAPFTASDLAKAPAGTVFRAVYTNRPDSNYQAVAYQHVVVYTVARAPVTPDVLSDIIDDTSIVQGQSTFPTLKEVPEIPFGYKPWGTPTFETEAGVKIATGPALSALAAGTIVYATYKADPDDNHDGAQASFRVKYTIAPRSA